MDERRQSAGQQSLVRSVGWHAGSAIAARSQPPAPVLTGTCWVVFASSLGTVSARKSNISVVATASATSLRCSVRRLVASVCAQARMVRSSVKSSQALHSSSGASPLIITLPRTSSSPFMIFLMRARGSAGFTIRRTSPESADSGKSQQAASTNNTK